MANRIYIDIIGADITFSAICQEDINVQAMSQFSRISDLVPGMNELVNMITTAKGAINSEISSAMGWVKNALDAPIWNKTEPVKLALDLNFFVQTSGYGDVWRPTMLLQSMCVLSKKRNGALATPGFNQRTIGKLEESVKESDVKKLQKNAAEADSKSRDLSLVEKSFPSDYPVLSKLCSIYVPGIVYIPIAFIESIQVLWSKQLTDRGYPIWSKVNCQFTGASASVFEDNFLTICPRTKASANNQQLLEDEIADKKAAAEKKAAADAKAKANEYRNNTSYARSAGVMHK